MVANNIWNPYFVYPSYPLRPGSIIFVGFALSQGRPQCPEQQKGSNAYS